jgi:hypothetical protein
MFSDTWRVTPGQDEHITSGNRENEKQATE